MLKKADKFLLNSSGNQIAISADKRGMTYGQKDKNGKRYEHFGFFDDTHKHHGKTLGEVLQLELLERRTNDDEYELLVIYANKPVEVGLSKMDDVVDVVGDKYISKDTQQKSKTYEFPIKVTRNDENVLNKIEILTEFLHVKKIGFEHRQLEFFIPLKFNIEKVEEDSTTFKQLTDIDCVYVRNQYGELIGYNVGEYKKRIIYNDTHEVWKFNGIEMQRD